MELKVGRGSRRTQRVALLSEESMPIRRTEAGHHLSLLEEVRDTRAHSNLLYELVHRDLTVRYKRSVLGFLWTMLHPLMLMLIFTVVFARLFRRETPHYETYFLSAYVAWNFFAQTTTNAMSSVAWNGPLLKRVRVPPSIFTLSTTLAGLVNLALSLLVLLAIMLVVRAPLMPALLFLPVSLFIVGIFTFGVSLGFTALSVFFADVREMYAAAIPALLYLTPVIYPVTIIPEHYRWLIRFNPMTYIVEIVRDPIYYGILPTPLTLLSAVVSALGALVFGWLVFRALAPRFHSQV